MENTPGLVVQNIFLPHLEQLTGEVKRLKEAQEFDNRLLEAKGGAATEEAPGG